MKNFIDYKISPETRSSSNYITPKTPSLIYNSNNDFNRIILRNQQIPINNKNNSHFISENQNLTKYNIVESETYKNLSQFSNIISKKNKSDELKNIISSKDVLENLRNKTKNNLKSLTINTSEEESNSVEKNHKPQSTSNYTKNLISSFSGNMTNKNDNRYEKLDFIKQKINNNVASPIVNPSKILKEKPLSSYSNNGSVTNQITNEKIEKQYDDLHFENLKFSSQNYQNPRSIMKENFEKPCLEINPKLQAPNPHHLNSPTHILGKNNPLPNHEPTKCSFKRNGIVKAYAANTNQGTVRNYNEDRVSIILNIMKPANRSNENWPKCSFFGVYDGHGGVACADFLRDNLHQFVIKDDKFPWDPIEAIYRGFQKAENCFLDSCRKNIQNGHIERSGSCCIVVLIVGEICYVANVGDSRAVLSSDLGNNVFSLSRDHKPLDQDEHKRIVEAGGKIYQTQTTISKPNEYQQNVSVLGPHRVFPGRLSVSRTFGDIEAKSPEYGGNPNVVISRPEIKSFKISSENDFIILASDGVFDKLTSEQVVKEVWNSFKETNATNVHQQCGLAVENILRVTIEKKSLDNITVVMICFNSFKEKFHEKIDSLNKNDVKNKNSLHLESDNKKNDKKQNNLWEGKGHRNSVDNKKIKSINEFDELKLKFVNYSTKNYGLKDEKKELFSKYNN